MAQETDTPQETLEAATETGVLPLSGLVLLGTFVKSEGSKALVRTSAGKVESIAQGDRVGGAQVMAIADGEVMLARGGTATRLRIPGG